MDLHDVDLLSVWSFLCATWKLHVMFVIAFQKLLCEETWIQN